MNNVVTDYQMDTESVMEGYKAKHPQYPTITGYGFSTVSAKDNLREKIRIYDDIQRQDRRQQPCIEDITNDRSEYEFFYVSTDLVALGKTAQEAKQNYKEIHTYFI